MMHTLHLLPISISISFSFSLSLPFPFPFPFLSSAPNMHHTTMYTQLRGGGREWGGGCGRPSLTRRQTSYQQTHRQSPNLSLFHLPASHPFVSPSSMVVQQFLPSSHLSVCLSLRPSIYLFLPPSSVPPSDPCCNSSPPTSQPARGGKGRQESRDAH